MKIPSLSSSPSGLTSTMLLAAGPATVSIKEWDVPTPNSRPHDPALAPDGSLWYTGQMSNTLGRLDPKTGQIKEFSLKTPGSGPHGLVADNDGSSGVNKVGSGRGTLTTLKSRQRRPQVGLARANGRSV